MSSTTQIPKHEVAQGDGEQEQVASLSSSDRIRFLIGFFLCGLMWALAFYSVNQILLPQRFKDAGMEDPETLISTLSAAGAVVALFANVILGGLSDRSRSKFGRRTPFMVGGSLLAGICIYLTYVFTTPSLIILAWCGFQLGLNALLAPFIATMADRIPKDGRASMSAVYGIGLSVGGASGSIVGAWFISVSTPGVGFAIGAILLAADGLIVTLIWPKEPSAANMPKADSGVLSMLKSFIPPTKDARDFYLALFGRLLLMTGYYITAGLLLYVIESYIGQDATTAATTVATITVVNMVVAIISSLIAGAISDRLQRRKPLVIICAAVFGFSFLFPYFWPTATSMIIGGAIGGFALGIYNACDGALNVDVLPSKEQSGKDLGFLNMSNTVGQVLGPLGAAAIYRILGTFKPIYPIGLVLVIISMLFIIPIKKAR
jgi:MFS family permease